MKMPAPTLRERTRTHTARRARLVGSVAVLGGAIGVTGLFMTLYMILTQEMYPAKPQRFPLGNAVIMGAAAFVPSAAVAGVIAYIVSEQVEKARNILIWVVCGFGFGVSFPFASGLFVPLSKVLVDFSGGIVSAGEVFTLALDSMFRGVSVSFSHGAFGVFTGMMGGLIMTVGAFVIDLVNTMSESPISKYGPIALALLLGIMIVAISAFGSLDFLSKLG